MTYIEILGLEMLKKFVQDATEKGICLNGSDLDPQMQALIIGIVEDYIDSYDEDR